MPCRLYCASTSRIDSRVPPMQERCGTPSRPSARNSSTVASVPSRVEPPAPNVTEQNAGSSCASCLRVARSFSTPSGVRGGKNSRLQTRRAGGGIGDPSIALREQQRGQEPRNQAVDDRAEDARPEAADMEALDERADPPEQEP